MTKLALRGLLSRKLRSVLTGFAVVIGVAFVVGTLVFTATIDESFKNLFERGQKGVDVSVQAAQPVKAQFSIPPTMPAETLDKVKAADGVDVAEGNVSFQFGTMLDKDGEPIVTNGPPTLLLSNGTEDVFSVLEYERDGRPPQTADEVAIDRGTAKRYDFIEGEKITISGAAPAKQFTISGVASLGDSDSLGGARFAVFTADEAHRMAGYDGWDSISISTGGGDPDEVKAALQRELGPDFEVQTGEEAAEQAAKDLSEALGFIRIALLIFAGVALLVGGFLIFNTFTVTVAQRTKELALLRVLGASRRQLLRSVMIETFAVGLIASVIGVLAGLVVAPALAAFLKAAGIDLGTTGIVVRPSTVVIGLVIGLVATMVSGFIPARRATRIEPVAAMRDSVTPGLGHLRTRRIVGSTALIGLGLLALFYGLFGGLDSDSLAAIIIGGGAVLMMFGFAFLAPLLVRPLARGLGAPLVWRQGLTGRLARENAMRQPQRTAVTAAALMVGLALVVLVAIFAAGLSASSSKTIDEQYTVGLVVQHRDGFSPIPTAAADTVAGVPGVDVVSPTRFVIGEAEGDTGATQVMGFDPATIGAVRKLEWVEGDASTLSGMTDSDAVVESDWAAGRDLAVGDSVRFTTPTGKQESYKIVGTFSSQAGLTTNVILTDRHARALLGLQGPLEHPGLHGPGRGSGPGPAGRGERAGAVPVHRGADQAGLQGQPDRGDPGSARPRLRPARAVGDRRAARDRQHAGAVGARAHARARDAARRRHEPQAGAPHGPRRVGDHGRHRRDPRHRARDRVRARDLAAAGRAGLRVHAADLHADRVLHPRRDRGGGGGDPARAAGVEGRRAEGRDNRVDR